MKEIINKLAVLLLAASAMSACVEHTEYNDTDFSAVETLLYPSDGYSLDLIDQADASLYFEWEVSKVGTPIYTVVFMNSSGEEVGRYLSDNNGQRATLNMPHSTLNTVAGEAGIAVGETGEILWTVCAGLGYTEKLSEAEPHSLTVKRYNSIEIPYRLYVTGEGSEFGSDPDNAQEMRDLGDGRFEIYTKLSGTYSFINRNEEGNKRTFGATESGTLTEGSDAADEGNGIYRIVVDFNSLTVEKSMITDVALLRAGTRYDGTPMATLQYEANGVWRVDQFNVPTDGDDRYRFRAVVDGEYEIWGSESGTDASDPGQIDGGTYFNVYVYTDVDNLGDPNDYARIWKFYSQLKGLDTNILLHMNPDADNYYHSFDLGFEAEAEAVSTLLAPESDASVELNAQAGAKVTFAWEPLSGSSPAVQLTTYSLVFFSDAALSSEVSRVSTGVSGSVDMTHLQLEQIAESAGIAAEASGDLYWAVESSLLGTTALSEGRKLTITRLKGIPTAVYISGEASEYGSGYKGLKSLGSGKFEIYTKLTSGTYYIADSQESDARYFEVSGGMISETTGGNTSTEEAIYRITLDFAAGTSLFEKITDVKYDFKMSGHVVDLPYQGDGVWGKNNFSATNGGNDTRYYLYMSFDGVEMRLGNKQADYAPADPDSFSEEGDSNFFVYLMEEPGDVWSYYFKFPASYRGTQNTISVKLNMSSHVENYYTYVTDQTIF